MSLLTWEWSRVLRPSKTPSACTGTCGPWKSWTTWRWTGSPTPPWFPFLKQKKKMMIISTKCIIVCLCANLQKMLPLISVLAFCWVLSYHMILYQPTLLQYFVSHHFSFAMPGNICDLKETECDGIGPGHPVRKKIDISVINLWNTYYQHIKMTPCTWFIDNIYKEIPYKKSHPWFDTDLKITLLLCNSGQTSTF